MAKRKDTVTIDLEKPPVEPTSPQTQPPQQPPVEPSRLEPDAEDQGPDLAAQIERLESERVAAQERAAQAEALRLQQQQQVQAWAQQQQAQTEQAQYDSVANALAAAQSEADQAQGALEQAWAVGDHRAAAEAQRRISKAEARITTLESGRDELQRTLEWRRANPQPQMQQPQQQGQRSIDQVLASMPNLTQKERDWLREHPDAVTNQRQVLRLQAAYVDAEDQGIRRGSPDYFRFFEERLGYAKPEDDEEEPVEERRSVQVAAPVSRTAPGVSSREARRDDRYIELSPDQREHARISGVSEFEYAKGLKRLREAKRNGMLQE